MWSPHLGWNQSFRFILDANNKFYMQVSNGGCMYFDEKTNKMVKGECGKSASGTDLFDICYQASGENEKILEPIKAPALILEVAAPQVLKEDSDLIAEQIAQEIVNPAINPNTHPLFPENPETDLIAEAVIKQEKATGQTQQGFAFIFTNAKKDRIRKFNVCLSSRTEWSGKDANNYFRKSYLISQNSTRRPNIC